MVNRKLSITYTVGGAQIQLFNGDIDELVWTDTPGGVKVEAKMKRAGGPGSNLFDAISKASKASTQRMIDEKRGQGD